MQNPRFQLTGARDFEPYSCGAGGNPAPRSRQPKLSAYLGRGFLNGNSLDRM